MIRINPYPPNFNKTPAKIIDPETGASTWALGSHKWKKYTGNFTKKAKINIKYNTILIKEKEKYLQDKKNLKWPLYKKTKKRPINKGREAVTVYIIIYTLACNRSGWYPHPKINTIVGSKENSNST